MWSTSCPRTINSGLTNTEFLRRHARRLLHRARADDTSTAMPIARRLLAAGVTRAETLAGLHKTRTEVQLKHILNMLAVELGHFGWDACKPELDTREPAVIDRYRFDAGAFGDYEKVWFAGADAAREWQREYGGYIVEYGDQAVAILWRE
ncbi:hypothetical protein [Caballeronia sp. 15715]|uniref:hypothetical protein n=1 Tax=unclassified Caballeronia TaxID=2646786 RepID=UPI0039E43801